MSLKNKLLPSPHTRQISFVEQLRPRSLRLRLVLWYGILVAVALSFFVLLILSLTTNTLNQGVVDALHTQARAATIEVNNELSSSPPYWPQQLVLNTLNTYRDPGVVVEVMDTQGTIRYDSDKNPSTRIPTKIDAKQATGAGKTFDYHDSFEGEAVQVEAVPIRAVPTGSVIGTLLVAKSLRDVNATLTLLQTLLLLTGGVTLVGALLGGWAIAARVLHPLADMAKTSRTIAATTARGTRIGNLSPRVRSSGGSDEMAQLVDAFNEMLADLQKATQGQRRFIADASHELRAPLTTIQGNLAFLQRHGDTLTAEERRTMLGDAYAETLRLTRLVEEMLLLARADANIDTPTTPKEQTLEKNKQPIVELDHVALRLVRQLRGRLNIEEAPPKLEIGHIEPVRVHGDEESIRRILLILLDNALKYTPPATEERKGRVTLSVRRREKEAVLEVSDTGIGIEPDELPQIFERFYRADRARSRHGTGLGLSIARTLVEQSGGRITAESTPGQGSTFSIWLPLAE